MSDKTKLCLKCSLFVVVALLMGALTACSALEGLVGGTEEAPPPEETAEVTQPPPTLPHMPTPTPTLAFGAEEPEEAATPESTPAEAAEEEATPTPVVSLEGIPGAEGTPEEAEIVEATPLGGLAEATAEAVPDTEATVEVVATPETTTYTVQAGDTLGEIAKEFGATVDEIVSLNEATYPSLKTAPDAIDVGWVLTVPARWSGTIYTVQQADVLEEIAKDHDTTVEAIVSLNEDTYPSLRTEPWSLEIGWELKIP